MTYTLKRTAHSLSSSEAQIQILEDTSLVDGGIPTFGEMLMRSGLYPLKSTQIEIFQVNLGKMCNQVCKHCHVDAGPDRREVMTRDTMQLCLDALIDTDIKTVDLTGGAPEMNPDFRWFVEELYAMGKKIIVRCNLTIILANPRFHDLPHFFKKHQVEVVSSLPHFSAMRTDAQRGEGVFEKSIEALKLLNEVGYGREGSGLVLNLVYNPSGAFLPGSQSALEGEFKARLSTQYGIDFNNLFVITNLPISRFLDFLLQSGNYGSYMQKLVSAYNPAAAANVMCRNTVSIGWDGLIYDCDFNQMLDLTVSAKASMHVRDFDARKLASRDIVIGQHCFGCTAGAGSSCGGATT